MISVPNLSSAEVKYLFSLFVSTEVDKVVASLDGNNRLNPIGLNLPSLRNLGIL